jgi:Spy/CpxP family protein refolding chaperone
MHRIAPLMIVSFALSAPAFAFDGPPPHDPGERLDKAFEITDATEDQQLTIRSLFDETLPELKQLHEEGHDLRERMQDAFRAPTIDRNEVEGIRLDGLDLADRLSATVLDLMVEAGNVLTQDQRVTLIEQREAMHEKHRAMVERFREARDAR